MSLNRPEFGTNDFFNSQDFRGLFLADNQEAIGERASNHVEDINRNTMNKFKQLSSYNDSIERRKVLNTFYK